MENNLEDFAETEGTVHKIDQKKIYIEINCQSACSGCHAKDNCNPVEASTRSIEILKESNTNYLNVGDKVSVFLKQKRGLMAVAWGYCFPLLLVLGLIIWGTYLEMEESLVAVFSLFTLIPYYTFLFFMRKKFQHYFSFTVKKK